MDYLKSECVKSKSLAEALAPIFENYSESGREGVTTNNFHEANRDSDIWEFIKGQHRIYCFKDPLKKSLVLLSHGSRKQTQRTRPRDIAKAAKAREAYIRARDGGYLSVVTIEQASEESKESRGE